MIYEKNRDEKNMIKVPVSIKEQVQARRTVTIQVSKEPIEGMNQEKNKQVFVTMTSNKG